MKSKRYALIHIVLGVFIGVILCVSVQGLISYLRAENDRLNWDVGELLSPNKIALPPFSLESKAVAVVTILSETDDYPAIVTLNDGIAANSAGKVYFKYIWSQSIPNDISLQHRFDSIALNDNVTTQTPVCYYLVNSDYVVLFKTTDFAVLSKYLQETGLS